MILWPGMTGVTRMPVLMQTGRCNAISLKL
jgi:hypothetical protein